MSRVNRPSRAILNAVPLAFDSLEPREVPATQIVAAATPVVTVAPTQTFLVQANYRVENPTDQPQNGLAQLRLHFDSSKFTLRLSNVTDRINTEIAAPSIQNDTQDFDNNPATDKFLLTSYLTITGKNFTSPSTLYKATFENNSTATSGSSKLTFTGVPADNQTFQGSDVTVNFGGTIQPPSGAFRLTTTYAVGAGPGGSSSINVYDGKGQLVKSIDAFPGFTGGVRTATGDVNNDGVDDYVVGTGPGAATLVRVFDGKTGNTLTEIQPFEASFTGGVYVAAGDLNRDGFADFVITPDEGGGPRARVFNGKTFEQLADFFGIDDPNFRGGARAGIADLNNDGAGDLLISAGFGGGPRVAGFNGTSIGASPEKLFNDFFAFESTLRNGVFISGGDLDGDGFAEMVAGGGPGGGPRVVAFDGKSLLTDTIVFRANFFAGDINNRGGARVTVKNLDGDNRGDIVVGAGTGGGSAINTYLGATVPNDGTPPAQNSFDAFPGFPNGVFVG